MVQKQHLNQNQNDFFTNSMILSDPTGVVIMSTLKQVHALHIVEQKQPLRNRLVSTSADFFVDFLSSFMLQIMPLKWQHFRLGWTLFWKSCTLGLNQVYIMCMGTLRYHTKFEAAEATPHLAVWPQVFGLYSTWGQKMKVVRIQPNLVGTYLWVIEHHMCNLSVIA